MRGPYIEGLELENDMQVLYNCKRCKVGRRVEYPSKNFRGEAYRESRDANGKLLVIYSGVWIDAIGGGKPTGFQLVRSRV